MIAVALWARHCHWHVTRERVAYGTVDSKLNYETEAARCLSKEIDALISFEVWGVHVLK